MTRGGKRLGAGRPLGTTKPEHLKRVKLGMYTLPLWLIRKLKKNYGRKSSRVIEQAILDYTGWVSPDDNTNTA